MPLKRPSSAQKGVPTGSDSVPSALVLAAKSFMQGLGNCEERPAAGPRLVSGQPTRVLWTRKAVPTPCKEAYLWLWQFTPPGHHCRSWGQAVSRAEEQVSHWRPLGGPKPVFGSTAHPTTGAKQQGPQATRALGLEVRRKGLWFEARNPRLPLSPTSCARLEG